MSALRLWAGCPLPWRHTQQPGPFCLVLPMTCRATSDSGELALRLWTFIPGLKNEGAGLEPVFQVPHSAELILDPLRQGKRCGKERAIVILSSRQMSVGAGRFPDCAEPRKCGPVGVGCRKAQWGDRFPTQRERGHTQGTWSKPQPAWGTWGPQSGSWDFSHKLILLRPPPKVPPATSSDGSRFQFHPEVSSFLGLAQQGLPSTPHSHPLPLSSHFFS